MVESRPARAAAKLWYLKMLYDQQSVPVPRDSPVIRSGADDPDRVLLIGNGPTHGWGTVTHELALTGQLARSLTRHTKRPTDIRYVGDEMMSIASVGPWLGDVPIADFDLLLLVLSMNDALRLTPAETYRHEMTELLDRLTLHARPSARIVVAGIQEVESLPAYRGLPGRIAQRRADVLNGLTRELIGRYDGVSFLDLSAPQAEVGRPYGSPQLYADWSEVFASVCAPLIDEARLLDPLRSVGEVSEHEWVWKPGERIMAEPGGHESLDRLVQEAKTHFGVDAAWVSLIDGDRQFYAANTSPVGRAVPLELTHCQYTVQGDDPLIVENSAKDERFKGNPLLDLSQLRFYAGAPIKNEDGDNIGTFCVLSVLPKSRDHVSEGDLREWASRAQGEVLKLVAATPEREPVARSSAAGG